MKVLIVLIGLVAYATCADHCYNNVIEECDNNQGKLAMPPLGP